MTYQKAQSILKKQQERLYWSKKLTSIQDNAISSSFLLRKFIYNICMYVLTAMRIQLPENINFVVSIRIRIRTQVFMILHKIENLYLRYMCIPEYALIRREIFYNNKLHYIIYIEIRSLENNALIWVLFVSEIEMMFKIRFIVKRICVCYLMMSFMCRSTYVSAPYSLYFIS